MIVEGFGITPYRSFGGDIQLFGPLGKVNLAIGQNNSGKSNILRFAIDHLSGIIQAARSGLAYTFSQPLDIHVGAPTPFKFACALALSSPEFETWKENFYTRAARSTRKALDKLLSSPALITDGNLAWLTYTPTKYSELVISPSLVEQILGANVLMPNEWNEIWSALTQRSGGNLVGSWIPETLHALSPVHRPLPIVSFVPAIREVQPKSAKDSDFSGRGLIDKLAELQNPGYQHQALKRSFEAINIFLREVTGTESAAIEIPSGRDTILVHMNGRTLPLESLGTGIHEVVILAAAATYMSGHLVCIEEPEIHLHPIIQRKLLDYLQRFTENQYIIATHSAHFLDVKGVNTFHVRLQDGQSLIRPAVSAASRFSICSDLGYRASDLLQANCVIWVEGPSDRIYLRNWLRQLDPDLIEGTHYSLMFYGGRLLSHLTANDPEIEDFISLRRLNRFIGILIDSDRQHAKGPLNETKRRIRDEFDAGPGFAWITAGREIENYIPAAILESAIRDIHRNVSQTPNTGRFEELLVYLNKKGERKEADKVKVACHVTQENLPLEVFDLKKRLNKVVQFIKTANGA